MKKIFFLISVIFYVFSLFSQNLNDGLLLYYPVSGNCKDISGNNFHGDVHAVLISDRNCNLYSAYSFNGINQYINFPNSSTLKPQLPVSFSFWVKFKNLSPENSVIFTTDFSTDNHAGVWMNLSQGKISVSYGDATGNTTPENRRTKIGTTVLQTDVWYYIAAVVEGQENMQLYINGINDGGTYSGSGGNLAYTTNSGSIGRKDNATVAPYYFNGSIDDFRYWNRTLTEQEILELYSPPNGLLLYYPFSGNANDNSGNNFNGIANANLTTDRLCNEDSAYSFNGINEYIDFPDDAELKPELPISFTYWVKFDDISPQKSVIFTTDYATDNHTGAWMNLSQGKITVSYGDATGNTTLSNRRTKIGTSILDTLQWYFIAAVIRGPQNMDLYINCTNDNGIYEGSGGNISYTNNQGSIGRKDNATVAPYYFQGRIDEFKYYNKELSVLDIYKDYFTPCPCQNHVTDTTHITVYDSISVTDTLIIDVALNIENGINRKIKVYPNPTHDIIHISIDDFELFDNYSIEISNTAGQAVFNSMIDAPYYDVDISQFGAYGLYFIKVRDNNQQLIHVRKIILY